MNKEVYLWVAFFIILIVAVVYLRYYYQPGIALTVTLSNSSLSNVYPYQKVIVPITVVNTGSVAVENLNIGIALDGNVTTVYKVTIPAGKQDTFYWNYTPTAAGSYHITSVVDPGKLYNIVDRSALASNILVVVNNAEAAEAYNLLPRNGIKAGNITQMSPSGYVASSYLFFNYSLNKVALTELYGPKTFLFPVLDTLEPYVTYIDTANGAYKNYSVYSIWLKGYLTPAAISSFAVGKSLNISNFTFDGQNVTSINFGNDTTMCSWYANGWLKTLSVGGGSTCAKLLAIPSSETFNSSASFSSPLSGNIVEPFDRVIENNTGFVGNKTTVGVLSVPGVNALVYKTITTNDVGSNICYGLVDSFNGIDYCSTYIFPSASSSNSVLNFSMIATTAYVNNDNLSILSIVNSSRLLDEVPINIQLIKDFNMTGSSLAFISGIANSCTVSRFLNCSSANLVNSTMTLTLTNNYTSQIKLSSISCSWYGNETYLPINGTLKPGEFQNVTTPCTNYGKPINGTPLSLHLALIVNYTTVVNATNKSYSSKGDAFIV